jgi:hypothetical protein
MNRLVLALAFVEPMSYFIFMEKAMSNIEVRSKQNKKRRLYGRLDSLIWRKYFQWPALNIFRQASQQLRRRYCYEFRSGKPGTGSAFRIFQLISAV